MLISFALIFDKMLNGEPMVTIECWRLINEFWIKSVCMHDLVCRNQIVGVALGKLMMLFESSLPSAMLNEIIECRS